MNCGADQPLVRAPDRRDLPDRCDQRLREDPRRLRSGHPGQLVRHRQSPRLPGGTVRLRAVAPDLRPDASGPGAVRATPRDAPSWSRSRSTPVHGICGRHVRRSGRRTRILLGRLRADQRRALAEVTADAGTGEITPAAIATPQRPIEAVRRFLHCIWSRSRASDFASSRET